MNTVWRRPFQPLSILACAACFSFAPLAQAAYQAPNWNLIPYDPNRTSLSTQERSQLADALSEYARGISGDTATEDALRAKAIGLALRLDPDNKSAVILNGKFKRGNKTSAEASSITRENLIKMFLMQVKKMQGETTGQDASAAAYILDFLSAIDPSNEDVLYQAEIAQRKWPTNWTAVLTPATPNPPSLSTAPSIPGTTSHPANPSTNPPVALKTQQSKVNGLVVMSSADNVLGGKVMEIIATASTIPNRESCWEFSTKVGDDMRISMDEAYRAVRLRHPENNKGVKFTLSFDDKYTKKAGGSAGTAFAVGMLSILENLSLDSLVALTGDITVDGKVRKVGGVPLKIRGAKVDGCKMVGIPAENESDVGNLMVMNGYRSAAEIQIFSLNTLDDALGLARKDRTEKVTEAITVFEDIQKALNNGSSLNSPDLATKLNRVLELTPNHLSAKYLRDKVNGNAPTQLTPNAAIDELFNAAGPLMVFFKSLDKEKEDKYQDRQILVFSLSKETYAGIREQLNQLEKKTPPQIQSTYYAMVNLLDRLEFFDGQYKGIPHRSAFGLYNSNFANDLPRRTRLDDILKQQQLLIGELTKLDYDKQFVESQIH